MKKLAVFIIFTIQILCSTAQTTSDSNVANKWIDSILRNPNLIDIDDSISFLKKDLSDLFKSDVSNLPIGYKGNNYQSFDIYFQTVLKDDTKNNSYFIMGKNKTLSKVKDFHGSISIEKIKYFVHFPEQNIYPDSIKLGIITGTYFFREENSNNRNGTFQGHFVVRFYKTPAQQIFIDDWTIQAEKYSNNLFVGTWKSYNEKLILPCNFGNYRIPESGDLDIGDKYFEPNEKYKSNGWENYGSLLNTYWYK